MTLPDIKGEIKELKEKLKKVKGSECEVFQRIVGYHRMIDNWNPGKAEEYKDRKNYLFIKKA